jgi:antitoxin YqcF
MSEKNAPVSAENKLVARHAAAALGGTPRVVDYADRLEQRTVGILSARDRPEEGLTAYSTVGLSDHPMPWGDGEFPTRLELVGMCTSDVERFANVLATAAFTIMRSGAVHRPGTVMPDCVTQSIPSSPLPHLYLTSPYLWEEGLGTHDLGSKKVTWLLAIPISPSEEGYLRQHGQQAFERVLAEREVDVANLNRPSAI